uniref:Solute carrier family 27 member 4 n=1 Tax=Macaca fascicularis TaxID=9541 RepID=A0A7N9D341_MACFA
MWLPSSWRTAMSSWACGWAWPSSVWRRPSSTPTCGGMPCSTASPPHVHGPLSLAAKWPQPSVRSMPAWTPRSASSALAPGSPMRCLQAQNTWTLCWKMLPSTCPVALTRASQINCSTSTHRAPQGCPRPPSWCTAGITAWLPWCTMDSACGPVTSSMTASPSTTQQPGQHGETPSLLKIQKLTGCGDMCL